MFLWSSGQAMVANENASLLIQWHMLILLIPGYISQSDKRMCLHKCIGQILLVHQSKER